MGLTLVPPVLTRPLHFLPLHDVAALNLPQEDHNAVLQGVPQAGSLASSLTRRDANVVRSRLDGFCDDDP